MKTALICVALMAASDGAGVAECLIPRPPCQALAESAIVVLVDVVEAAESWEKVGTDTLRPIPQMVRLKVIERFKGVAPQQREITGSIQHKGEAVFLAVGKRYLLYAYQDREGTWITSCSRTKLVQDASDELRQLRRCVKK